MLYPRHAPPLLIRLPGRLPLPVWATAVGLGLLMLLPDLVANSPLTASVPHQPVPFATSRALVPAIVTAYCLLASRYLYAATQRMLADFRPVVRVNDTKYSHHTTLLLHVDRRIEWLVILIGALVALNSYISQVISRPGLGLLGRLPALGLAQATVLVVFGVVVALFIHLAVDSGVGVYHLLRLPLALDVFDYANLDPIKRLSVQFSLAMIGLVTIPVIVFRGFALVAPLQVALYIAGFLAALIAFGLPLWGVHRQMSATRNKELSAVGARLRALYHELFYTVDRQVEGRDISDEVNTLTQFHGLIKATPVWPYASVRIVLQILAPLAVPMVTWVTQEYLVPLVLSWL